MTHTFLIIFYEAIVRSVDLMPLEMLHGLLYHSAVLFCSAGQSFTSAGTFYDRNPLYSLLTYEGSPGLGGGVTKKY